MPLFNQRVTEWKYALEVKFEELRRKEKKKKTLEAELPNVIKYPCMGVTRIAF